MTSILDGYLTGYQWTANVFTGTYQPQNAPPELGGPFTGVKYRLIDVDEEASEGQSPDGATLAETQAFEVWTITLNGGNYNPKPRDIFTDVDGGRWSVIKQDKGDLVTSGRVRPTITLFCRKIQ